MAELSYLVMTAADCADYNEDHPHGLISLNQMLEVRARDNPDAVCVGFITRRDDDFECDTYSAYVMERRPAELAG